MWWERTALWSGSGNRGWNSILAAVWAMRDAWISTVVILGMEYFAWSELSYPMTLMSSGTLRPAWWMAWMAPRARRSLKATRAVG